LKQKLEEKKEANKYSKKKKAYIALEDNASNLSSSLSKTDEEWINLCLKVNEKPSRKASLNSFESQIEENYYRLGDVFKELHEKAKHLSYSIKKVKERSDCLRIH